MHHVPVKVLLVEDDEDDFILIRDLVSQITSAVFELKWVASCPAALEEIRRGWHDVYLLDYRLGECSGLELLRDMMRMGCNAPVIFITGQGDYGTDVEAMKSGAADYLIKGRIDAPLLERSIRYAVEHKRMEAQLRKYYFELDDLVRTRTARLEKAVEQLRKEAAERRQAEKALKKIQDELEKRVEQRTVELKASNEQLRREIEERRRAEEILRSSEEKYRGLIESMTDVVFRVDIAGFFTFCSPRAEVLTGYSQDELLKMSFRELFAPELLPLVENRIVRIKAKEATEPFEAVILSVERQEVHVEVCLSALFDRWGEAVAIQGMVRDISEQKRSQEERARLAAAIDQTGEGVIITDCEGIVQYVNPAFERMSGYSRSEIIGRNIAVIRSVKHGEDFHAGVWNTLRRGEVWTGHFTNRKRDGGLFEVEATVSPVRNDAGTIINYVAVERDVTHEAQLEKQLRQAQKMEALGTLAGGIAHDFKNLLIPIMLNTELVLCDSRLNAPSRESLEQVLESCRYASGVVKQILTFSRGGAEERKTLQMGSLVSETLKLLQSLLPKNIEVRHSLSVPVGADTVLVDDTQIQQVIMNLSNNAAHAMRENGGVLDIALTAVSLHPDSSQRFLLDLEPGTYVKLTVGDTGHGMNSATMERIFDPFFTTKAPGEGTGLGLAVVYGIVKKHGGAISVSSEPGGGAVFDVFFPVTQDFRQEIETPPMREEETPASISRGNERVLFVDDEKAVCESIGRVLTYLGYRVTTVAGGPKALETFRKDSDRFDLVITDFAMPGLTGIELSKALKQIRPEIPVILCTAFQGIPTEEVEAAGIRETVLKPIVMGEIAEAIRRVMEAGC